MKIRRKNPLTIIEVMIVITIISIVGGLMSYNMKGSLEKGRSFKSEAASREAYDILSLELSSGKSIDDITKNTSGVIINSGLVKSTAKLLNDGWGTPFQILPVSDDDFIVYSAKWIKFLQKNKKMTPEEIEENYPWAYNISLFSQGDNDDQVES